MKYLRKNVLSAHLKFKQLFGCVEKTVFWEDLLYSLIPFPHRICCSQIQLFWCLRIHLAEQDQCLFETCTNNVWGKTFCKCVVQLGFNPVIRDNATSSLVINAKIRQPCTLFHLNKSFCPHPALQSQVQRWSVMVSYHLEREGSKPMKSYKF